MPIVPVAQPVDASVLKPGPDPSTHQRYNEFPPQKFYNIDVKAVMQKFHPDLPASVLFGYNGQVPGPTFHANYGEPILIRFNNNLPTDHVDFGIPSISTHMHNFQQPAKATAIRPILTTLGPTAIIITAHSPPATPGVGDCRGTGLESGKH